MAIGEIPGARANNASSLALARLKATSTELATRRLRLASGNRLQSAEEDTAGFSTSSRLRAKIAGQLRAHSNATDARSLLSTANGSLGVITEILQAMKEKSIQAANDTMGSDERTLVQNQLDSLSAEIGDILGNTEFNGRALFDSAMFNFQVGEGSGDSLAVTVGTLSVGQLGLDAGSLGVGDAGTASGTLSAIDAALITVLGRSDSNFASQSRLSAKQVTLLSDIATSEKALSQISDADLAKEQMGVAQLEAAQQTAISSIKGDSSLGEVYL